MMNVMIKVLVICLVAALLAAVLKKSNPEGPNFCGRNLVWALWESC